MNNRTNLIVIMLVAAAVFALLLSCCDDCPVCPDPNQKIPPYKGWLYVTASEVYSSLYKIDTETGEQVDSILKDGPFVDGLRVDVSKDGRYLAVSYCCEFDSNGQRQPGFTRIHDAQTLAVIKQFPFIFNPLFATDQNLLLGFSHDTLRAISVPGFEVLATENIERIGLPVLSEEDTLTYWIHGQARDTVVAYNYVRREIVQTWGLRNELERPMFAHRLAIHPDGNRLYFLAEEEHTFFATFGCYDLKADELVSVFREFNSFYGDIEVRPDGMFVYVTDPGSAFESIPNPGTVYVFDAESGSYTYGISLVGFGTYPGSALSPGEMVFSPNGGYAYVASGRIGKGSGSILTLDAVDHRVISVTWPELGHYLNQVAVGPKL